MTNVDSQRIKEIRDNTKAMAEAFSRIANTLADALELYISTRTETQTETQNSNLTFEKTDCEGCDRYENGGELCDMCALEKGKEDAQTVIMVKDHGRKQALEMIDLYHELKTENSSEKPNNADTSMDYLKLMDERKMDEKIAKRVKERGNDAD